MNTFSSSYLGDSLRSAGRPLLSPRKRLYHASCMSLHCRSRGSSRYKTFSQGCALSLVAHTGITVLTHTLIKICSAKTVLLSEPAAFLYSPVGILPLTVSFVFGLVLYAMGTPLSLRISCTPSLISCTHISFYPFFFFFCFSVCHVFITCMFLSSFIFLNPFCYCISLPLFFPHAKCVFRFLNCSHCDILAFFLLSLFPSTNLSINLRFSFLQFLSGLPSVL